MLAVSTITYVRLARGFVYLVAVIDWHSRKVLAWRVSNTPDSGFRVDCLGQALQDHGPSEIFNARPAAASSLRRRSPGRSRRAA